MQRNRNNHIGHCKAADLFQFFTHPLARPDTNFFVAIVFQLVNQLLDLFSFGEMKKSRCGNDGYPSPELLFDDVILFQVKPCSWQMKTAKGTNTLFSRMKRFVA